MHSIFTLECIKYVHNEHLCSHCTESINILVSAHNMKAVINSQLINKLQPDTSPYDVRDTRLTGFLIRVNPTGNMTYVCQYRRGKRINISPVHTLTPIQAHDKAK